VVWPQTFAEEALLLVDNRWTDRGGGEMKKTLWGVLAAFLLTCTAAPGLGASELDVLVNKLVESGVLSEADGEAVLSQARKEAAEKERKDNFVKTTWRNRLQFETPDGNFKGVIGGRLHADLVYVDAQSELEDLIRPEGDFHRRNQRAFLRRARLYTEGTVYKNFFYKLQYDFAAGSDGFRDAYLGMQNIPYIGKVTVGQFKEPFSLDQLTSSNNITFIERALPDLLAPGRSWGVAVNNAWFDQRLTLGIGGFRNSTQSGMMAPGEEWNFTTRVTGLPWYGAPDKLLHVGAAYSLRFPESRNNRELRFRQRPELHTADRFIDTGDFRAHHENRVGLELAAVYGPLSVQSEFVQTFVDDLELADGTRTGYFHGCYVFVSYILTGESRRYSKGTGVFSSVSPKNNFSIKERTWGGWELAARYSYLDLTDAHVGIEGGKLDNATAGVNWYLNPMMKVMFNYVHTHRSGVGNADGFQTRFQVAF